MALLPTGQWVPWTNLPSAADFQFRICTDTLVAATVLTKLRSNRYFSARELRIDFTEHELHELHEYVALSLKIREIQEIRVQKSTLNIIFLVAHGSHGSHGFFSLQATIRISPRLRLYYITAYGA